MEEKDADRLGQGCPLTEEVPFPTCGNGKHAVSMYAQGADLIQQELTTEVWLKPPERYDMKLSVCAPQPRPPSLCNSLFSL